MIKGWLAHHHSVFAGHLHSKCFSIGSFHFLAVHKCLAGGLLDPPIHPASSTLSVHQLRAFHQSVNPLTLPVLP